MEHPATLQEAIRQYDFVNPHMVFIRHNENITYRIETNQGKYLLRIHKPMDGFSLGVFDRTDHAKADYIHGEMQTLLRLRQSGFPAQSPVANHDGKYVTCLSDGTMATVLSWISGETLDKMGMTPETGYELGKMIGKLHGSLNGLEKLNIKRYRYDLSLLHEMKNEIVSALGKEHIAHEYESVIMKSLVTIGKCMIELDGIGGMRGYAHADLSPSNMIITQRGIVPIDFSLSGYGYPIMDIGMVFSQYADTKIQRVIRRGYEEERRLSVPIHAIQCFFALSVLLFIACQHDRFYGEDWFPPAIKRWSETIFEPLADGRQFVLL